VCVCLFIRFWLLFNQWKYINNMVMINKQLYYFSIVYFKKTRVKNEYFSSFDT
jgi:hypothetical protein